MHRRGRRRRPRPRRAVGARGRDALRHHRHGAGARARRARRRSASGAARIAIGGAGPARRAAAARRPPPRRRARCGARAGAMPRRPHDRALPGVLLRRRLARRRRARHARDDRQRPGVHRAAVVGAAARAAAARRGCVATSVCVVGLALLVGSGASSPDVDPVGLLLALASGLGYAVYTVAAKRLMNDGHRSDEVMAGGVRPRRARCSCRCCSPSRWRGWRRRAGSRWRSGSVWPRRPLAYVLFGRGLRHLPAGPVTTLVLAEPVVATVLGVARARGDARRRSAGSVRRSSWPASRCRASSASRGRG